MAMKTVAIIQARMGSTRLPGKVLMKLQGRTVLDHVITRVKQAKLIDEIIVATTTLPEDDVLAAEAAHYGVCVYRGSSDNVLSRYYEAAKKAKAQVVVRITSDCPLIDPKIIDAVVDAYFDNDAEIATNAGNTDKTRTFPRGLDVEIFSFELLEQTNLSANKPYHFEHVTPYMYEIANTIFYYRHPYNYSNNRWTLDTNEDYLFIKYVYDMLFKGTHDFYLDEILEFVTSYPEIASINADIKQKNYFNQI